MSAAMRFKRILVQDVGILGERAIDLGPLSPGINVISGPNECGKSSIVRAIRAALFQRHGSGHKSIHALQPYGSKASPYVEIEFEFDGEAYLLEKRFLKKGSSRITSADRSVSLQGDEADTWLMAKLEAREPAKKGVNVDDMGVWGLLWVNQDAYAVKDPSDSMGDHVRDSLSKTIGSLVGNVMGGQHGVALKRTIEEEYEKYWTAKQHDRATDRLLKAREGVEELKTAVDQLRAKLVETEKLGDDLRERELELDDLAKEEDERTRSVVECEAAAREGDAIERARDEAARALQASEDRLLRATKAQSERSSRRAGLAEAEETARLRSELVERLRTQHLRRQEESATATQTTNAARREVDALQQSVDAQGRRLEQHRARTELRALEEKLTEARRLEVSIRGTRESLRALPDTEALKSITDLAARRAQHEEHIARYATQVRVERAGREVEAFSVATRRVLAFDGLGSFTLDPPREGFAKAREAWQAVRGRLTSRLEALRVESVSVARVLAAEHRRLALDIDALRADLSIAAPKGLSTIAQDVERVERTRADLERQRDEAAEHSAEVDRLEQLSAGAHVQDAALQQLVEFDARVKVLLEQEAHAAVRVTVRPLAAVRVQFGERETPRLLTAGNEVRRPITSPTTIVIDERVQIEIDPGTAAHTSAGALEQAQSALASMLSDLDVSSVDEARKVARKRVALDAQRTAAERAFRAQAPDGLSALADRLMRASRNADDLRIKLQTAQSIDAKLAARESELSKLPLDPARFEELDALDQQCLSHEQTMRRLAGRILSAEGLLSEATQGREDLLERVIFAVEDTRIEVVPGEVSHDVELPVIERELAAKFKLFGLTSVDEARRAHNEWIAKSTALDLDRRNLAYVAPKGIAPLDDAVARGRTRVSATDETDETEESKIIALSLEQKRLEARRLDLTATVAREETAQRFADETRAEFASAERAFLEHAARRATLADQLRVDESFAGDTALRVATETSRAEVDRDRAVHEGAARAHDSAMPEIRRADLEREKVTLAEVGRRAQAQRESYARSKGSLDGKLGEGYYDRLAERSVALDAAQSDLARVEREAKALRLLRDTAAGAYAEAQTSLMQPVYKEAAPLLEMIRPGTTFRMNQDSLQLEQVLRNGFEEDFKDLSGGAREQLAVVVRIALARVFARQRRALPLVLDDVLGWTDDRRLRAMLNVLERTAQDMQVILLTCHPSRFRGLTGAQTFALDALKT